MERDSSTPERIKDEATIATEDLLPKKSKNLYLKEYHSFVEWQRQNNVASFSERGGFICLIERIV
jgi:hypothetical protein